MSKENEEEKIEVIKNEPSSYKIDEVKEEVINLSEEIRDFETIEKMKKKLEKNREEQNKMNLNIDTDRITPKNSKKNVLSSPRVRKRTPATPTHDTSNKNSPTSTPLPTKIGINNENEKITPVITKGKSKSSSMSLISPSLDSFEDEHSDLGLSLDQETALTLELETVNVQKQYEQTMKERIEYSKGKNYISILPPDIFAEILTYLPQPEILYTVNQVSKQFYNNSNNDLLWKKLYQKYYYNQEIDPRLIKYIPEFKSPCLKNYRKNLILLKKKKDKYLKRSQTKIDQFRLRSILNLISLLILPLLITISLILFTFLSGIYIDGFLNLNDWWVKLLIVSIYYPIGEFNF